MDGDINRSLDAEPDRDTESGEAAAWDNPPFAIRVLLVALVFAAPGVLTALMVNFAVNFTGHTTLVATAGAVLFAFVGGCMEASE